MSSVTWVIHGAARWRKPEEDRRAGQFVGDVVGPIRVHRCSSVFGFLSALADLDDGVEVEVARRYGDEVPVRGGQSVDGEPGERRRAVDDDVLVLGAMASSWVLRRASRWSMAVVA